MTRLPFTNRSRLGQQVGFHARQDREQPFALRVGYTFKRFATGDCSDGENFAQQRMSLLRQMELPDAPIGRMGAAVDEATLLQLVDDARERDRLDFEDLGEVALLDSLIAREM